MSARELLLEELNRQPDTVAQKLLDYLHSFSPQPANPTSLPLSKGHFQRYWSRYYGIFRGEDWEEPQDLPVEKREEW